MPTAGTSARVPVASGGGVTSARWPHWEVAGLPLCQGPGPFCSCFRSAASRLDGTKGDAGMALSPHAFFSFHNKTEIWSRTAGGLPMITYHDVKGSFDMCGWAVDLIPQGHFHVG